VVWSRGPADSPIEATLDIFLATKHLVTFGLVTRLRTTRRTSVPPRQSETLTEAELRIMNVLWEKGSGTVQQVLDSITEKPPLAYNSVLTTIRVLERKGYLKHLKDGRAHVYTPLVGQKDATRSEIRHLVNRFFKNSHEQLVLNLLEDQGIGPGEIGRLRQMLIQNDTVQKGTIRKDAE
jgi:BlaI family transcriptional regulator, penicillinase repressor